MNKLIIITICGVLLFSASSCKKFLEKAPDNRAELSTAANVAKLVASAYPQAPYAPLGEMYSDNVSDKGPNATGINLDLPFPQMYKFEDVDEDSYNTPAAFWNGAYAGIAAANQALEAIEKNDIGPSANPYKGEALVARAFSHFLLVTFFAKPYDPDGANDTPGIPYILTPETNPYVKYARGTVASVYAQIEKDLEAGIPLLKGGEWQVPAYHFTPAAAHAFAARFYLFKKQWQKVIDHANQVVPNGDFTGSIRNYPAAASLTTDGTAYANFFCNGDAKFNLLVHEMDARFQRTTFFANRYAFGPAVYSWYTASNVTGTKFYTVGFTYSTGNYTLSKLREFFFVTNAAASIGYPMLQMPLLTTDEALLNRAEAYLQLGNYDGVLADLNMCARYKFTTYNPATMAVTLAKAKDFYKVDGVPADDKTALLNTILDFKRWTFMNEGMRYWDMIRYKMPIKHLLIANDNSESYITLEANDNRRVFQIPKDAVQLGGLQPNPR
ncbi:RagB/SusD family nutrient uptake outer membrane protein [Niabella sp.]|uniref:RagB/SusD family nutrient uptake outer membrane protein n=1 Tax=Niabella sp. TaxID=1962976 RepID=UPI0026057542|nr:RagB/SusD family nutrient uptake outer membrane protein [Niabella sp.]